MKRISFVLAIAPVLSGCLLSQDQTSVGVVWQNTVSPIKPEEQMKASGVVAEKVGWSCKYQIAGLVTWGDDSYGAALRAGDISKVASVDRWTVGSQVLGSGKVCTIITGK